MFLLASLGGVVSVLYAAMGVMGHGARLLVPVLLVVLVRTWVTVAVRRANVEEKIDLIYRGRAREREAAVTAEGLARPGPVDDPVPVTATPPTTRCTGGVRGRRGPLPARR